MARPTKTAMSAIKKLAVACYEMFSKDMKMYYKKAELYQTMMQKWYGSSRKLDTKPYMLELYSDSDWASCKASRGSTSSGPIFLKQVLQFLVNDKGGLGSQSRVTMQLRLNSTSAQAFFTRLGTGKAKTFVNTFAVNETSNDASMV